MNTIHGDLLSTIRVDYEVDTERILGNTSNKKDGTPHCRFQLFVRWPPQARRRVNPFTYRGDFFDQAVEPHQLLQSCIKNFQRNHEKDKWVFAFLNDTFYLDNDERRIVLSYVNGVVEQNRLHNYYMMLEGFKFIDLIKPNYETT